jgi:hypothetical protein
MGLVHPASIQWLPYFFTRVKWPEPTVCHLYPHDAGIWCEYRWSSVTFMCLHGRGREKFQFQSNIFEEFSHY